MNLSWFEFLDVENPENRYFRFVKRKQASYRCGLNKHSTDCEDLSTQVRLMTSAQESSLTEIKCFQVGEFAANCNKEQL